MDRREGRTGRHELWLRSQRFDLPGRQLAFDTAYESMLMAVQRRDRLDQAIIEMAEHGELHRPGAPTWLSARHRDVDRVRVGGRDRGLALAGWTWSLAIME